MNTTKTNTMISFPEFQAILAKQMRIEDADTIKMESQIKKDLGADSLDILQLLMRLEDDYGFIIPDEKLAAFNTVGDVYNFLGTLK